MPELPDIEVYRRALQTHVVGRTIVDIRLASPFVLRSAVPSIKDAIGRTITATSRLGKRVVFTLDDGRHLIVHLMIAGRFRYEKKKANAFAKVPGRIGLFAFDLGPRDDESEDDGGSLVLTEAGTKKRASLYFVEDDAALAAHDPGGLDVMNASAEEFGERLRQKNQTIKRALTDPRVLSGIGNAYSDEILHAAKMSPFAHTQKLTDDQTSLLHACTVEILRTYTEKMASEVGDGFPKKVTAFRDDMAVHGRFKQPCPRCGDPVQRIVKGKHETNYCATCQTDGRILADRALSRLLGKDWPRTLEEMDDLFRPSS